MFVVSRPSTLAPLALVLTSLAAPVRAQEAVAAVAELEPPSPATTAGVGEASPALASPAGEASSASPAAAPEPAESGAIAEQPPAAVAAVAGLEPPPEEVEADDPTSWTDDLSFRVFADAYVGGYWTLPNALEGDHADVVGHRAFDTYGGPTIAFAGIDVRYAPHPIGATLDLRFGTSVPRLIGAVSGLPEGMQFLKQAFVSWRPVDELQIDFGEFDTIYGAEVSESWLNPTYTRGALYTVVQPYYHTGFRAAYAPIPELTLTAIAVNGWNNVADNNDGKTVGVQGTLVLGDLTMALGYLTGPEQADHDDRFRHFVDLVVRWSVGDFSLSANGDVVIEDVGDGRYDTLAGGMITGRLAIIPELAVAARGEYIGDPDDGSGLVTGTLTLEALPDPHLIIRLDTRLDVATDDRFVDTNSQPTDTVVSSVLGVVVRSD